MSSSAQDNQGYEATNVSTADNVTCAITPFDAVGGTFRSAGYGTPQVVRENVTVKAQDHAAFEVECVGLDTVPFDADANQSS